MARGKKYSRYNFVKEDLFQNVRSNKAATYLVFIFVDFSD